MRKTLLTLCLLSALLLLPTGSRVRADAVTVVGVSTTCEERADCSGAFEWMDCTQKTYWSDGHVTEYSYSTIGYYAIGPVLELPPCCCN